MPTIIYKPPPKDVTYQNNNLKNIRPTEARFAYLDGRRHKRWKANTLQFSLKIEESEHKLIKKIKQRNYLIKPSLCFIAFLPVKREIFAGDFCDRVIHHLVFQRLNYFYEKLFINDCYSCRKNRGTSYGIKRIAKFLRAVSDNYQKSAYVLKLDISGYFMNIDRHILYQQNKKLINKFFHNQPADRNENLYLVKKIIFNDPTTNCRLRGLKSDWQGLPKNKSLFSAQPNKGLPIGNLTSQLFGNVYLNDFDHFVKEKLKCHYYGRYVDDMVFLHKDKKYLTDIIPLIKKYLKDNLDLDIHPKKIYLQPISHGLSFLGAFIKPHRIYCGQRIVKNFRQKIRLAANGQLQNPAFLNSYLGQMQHYSSFKLRQNILNSPDGQRALINFKLIPNKKLTKVQTKKEPL